MPDGSSSALPLYEVTVMREDEGWVVTVDGVPGSVQVETFAELDPAVRGLITEGTGTKDFDVFWTYV